MKKYGSLIALGVVAVLAVLILTTDNEPQRTVDTPYSVETVPNLKRIELTQPGEDGGLVVLERAKDRWQLTKPVEAPVAERFSKQLDEALANDINTDDITLSADKAKEFGLDADSGTRVALYGEGETPVAEFTVGKTIVVEETNAKRTYIAANGEFYRAQTDLGDVLGQPVAELRDKTVQKLDRQSVTEISVEYEDTDEVVTLKRDNKADVWTLSKPSVDFSLERSQVSTLVNSVTNLNATGFVDDKEPSDVGLKPPHATIGVRTRAGDVHRLKISKPADDKAHVMVAGNNHIYEIAETTANALTPTPLSLRNRIPVEIPYEDITRVDFGGEEKLSVARGDDGWTFARGAKGAVKEQALRSKLMSLARLRAVRYETPTLDEAGLKKPTERVVLHTAGGKHTLLIGGEADKKGNLYGKWESNDQVMVIPQWIKERATPKAADLQEDES